jgi:hypothetical protein
MTITPSAPYDCSAGSDDDADVLPCFENGPQWWQIGRQVGWSLAFWCVAVTVSPLMRHIWNTHCDPTPLWVQKFIGTKYRMAHNVNVEAALCFAQFMGSGCVVCLWIFKSYDTDHDYKTYAIELICVIACILHACFDSIKFSFSWKHALSFSVFLDCLTLPPLVMQKWGAWAGGSWLTLAYLRVFQAYKSVHKLVEINCFDSLLDNFVQECILAVLQCLVVVFAIAGTLFVMEGLGDIDGFSDSFVDSGMGEISFLQMVYFSFVTISTVKLHLVLFLLFSRKNRYCFLCVPLSLFHTHNISMNGNTLTRLDLGIFLLKQYSVEHLSSSLSWVV